MPDIAFLNGRFTSLDDAKVSIDDRGFQFGDGVYEVIRTYKGRPFQLEAHLSRLDHSARALDIRQPYSHQEWSQHILEGIRRAAYPEVKVYIQVTRGVAPRDHAYAADLSPTVVMTVRELHHLSRSVQAASVSAMTVEDIRWGRCDIKSINLLPNVLARQQAKRMQMFEAILVREGVVTEGAVSNVMAVRAGVIITAPEGPRILSGVTRAVVIEIARQSGLEVQERYMPRHELYDAEEVFLTGTTVEVLGVTQIDGRIIGEGRPGVVTGRLAGLFAEHAG
ncbi:D-amino-acid transaminase [Petrachloros mirabilis]